MLDDVSYIPYYSAYTQNNIIISLCQKKVAVLLIFHYIAYMQYNEGPLSKYMYTFREIGPYLEDHYNLKLTQYISLSKYIKNSGYIEELDLSSEDKNLPKKLYYDRNKIKHEISPLDIACNLREKTFLTGYYVFSILGLTEYIPKVIHVDWVRTKPRTSGLKIVDNDVLQQIAFKPKRESNSTLIYNGYKIILLNGVYLEADEANYFQWVQLNNKNMPKMKTFRIEKLLIDSVVNYHYFGGADIVWEILMNLKSMVDIDEFIKIFSKLSYIYPYQNSLGYIAERAGVPNNYLNYFYERVDKDIKFHLFMGDSERRIWNEKWNIYVPKRFA